MSIYDLGSEDPDIYIDGVSISSFKCLLNLLTGQDNRLSLEFISVYLYPGAIPLPAPPRHNLPRFVYTQEVEAELQSWHGIKERQDNQHWACGKHCLASTMIQVLQIWASHSSSHKGKQTDQVHTR